MTLQLIKKHSFDMVFDSQKVFRLILNAMCNPGRVVQADGVLPVAMTLLDNEVSFCVCGNTSLSEEIITLTLAKKENIEAADYIFISDLSYMECAIENAKCGTLPDPHKSATVIIQNDGEPDYQATLSGPGIDGQTEDLVTRTGDDAIAMRDAQHYEYPQGIDLLFISSAGELFAIPRLTRMEVR